MASTNDLWKEARQHISACEQRSTELSELIRSAKASLSSITDQVNASKQEKATLLSDIHIASAKATQLDGEQKALQQQVQKLEKEGSMMVRQLSLLKQTKSFLKLKQEQERESYAKELASQRARLENYRQLIQTADQQAFDTVF